MSSGQIFLTLAVAVVVLGPDKLPLFARHVGHVVRYYRRLQRSLLRIWQQEMNTQQLQKNIERACEADMKYRATSNNLK